MFGENSLKFRHSPATGKIDVAVGPDIPRGITNYKLHFAHRRLQLIAIHKRRGAGILAWRRWQTGMSAPRYGKVALAYWRADTPSLYIDLGRRAESLLSDPWDGQYCPSIGDDGQYCPSIGDDGQYCPSHE
jgi:hypothetical protein